MIKNDIVSNSQNIYILLNMPRNPNNSIHWVLKGLLHQFQLESSRPRASTRLEYNKSRRNTLWYYDDGHYESMESVEKHRSRTRLVFVNHLDFLVKVYWFRSTEPDKLHKCCEVLPSSQGGCEGKSLATKYIYGTRLKLIWKDSKQPPTYLLKGRQRKSNDSYRTRPLSRWKNSAIKMQYLLQQMIRLG